MTSRPRIAIPVPTSIDADYNRTCLPLYAAAVEQSGGQPVTVALEEASRSFGDWDGVLLPGSLADVDPSRYGQAKSDACGPRDVPREVMDRTLLEQAEHYAKPVLGICYGMQSLNVWHGGSLLQDLAVFPVNHAAGAAVGVAHTAEVQGNTTLQELFATDEIAAEGQRLPINSSHHQAVFAVGDALRISAICPQDGVIEAIEGESRDGPLLLAVQWHPERSFASSAASRALFARLIAEAARRA